MIINNNFPLLDDNEDDEELPNTILIDDKKIINENLDITSSDIEIINENELNENNSDVIEMTQDNVEISINNIENEKFVGLKIRFSMEDKKSYEMNIQIPEDVYYLICEKLAN